MASQCELYEKSYFLIHTKINHFDLLFRESQKLTFLVYVNQVTKVKVAQTCHLLYTSHK